MCDMCVGIETLGKNAVVCGRSKNVGLPIALLLHADGAGETEACQCLCCQFLHALNSFWPTYHSILIIIHIL